MYRFKVTNKETKFVTYHNVNHENYKQALELISGKFSTNKYLIEKV